ncbi:hypothetical protein DSM104443_00970 [Usitatibacter rugosus]|jgi:hypothetical protein|uniref:Uncharacterized protein n=1 Tax=Usitatibacter rugosus TaxID=2732067 RepID=A0A6M4GRF9_9PROT|nr:hypothetical protein [Usitatibacter rugosus]QJR09919.1 hypothetical protein DSM104443_00970 [Usitatibacter rugosus]
MSLQPVQFGDEGQVATRELAVRYREACLRDARLVALRPGFDMLEAIDRQYGGSRRLELEDTDELVAGLLNDLARLRAEPELALGVALWAMRHEVEMGAVEVVVNALAQRSNNAKSPQELSAVFGLMQGLIANVTPLLSADLERSNPERPWRILHINFAITAIRTEDPAMMDFAFDALDEALPGERGGFYSEALALVLAPGVAPAVRERIEARHLKWTAGR